MKEFRRRGLDPEDLLLIVAQKIFGLDPVIAAEARLELAEKYLDEAKRYLKKGDAFSDK